MHHSLQIMFILPLMTGHLFWKATIVDGLYKGVPLYQSMCYWPLWGECMGDQQNPHTKGQ